MVAFVGDPPNFLKVPQIYESKNLCVVEPFPMDEAHRIWKWMKGFKNIILTDGDAKNKDEFLARFRYSAENGARTFGVVDRYNKLDKNTNMALLGVIVFEPASLYNGYVHVASRYSAFGSRLMDEAGQTVLKALFESDPNLLRVSAYCHASNRMAISFAKRAGFEKEGRISDMIQQHGEPKDVLHFGLTRRKWNKCQLEQQPHLLDQPLESLEEPLAEVDDKVVSKEPKDELALKRPGKRAKSETSPTLQDEKKNLESLVHSANS